jgi:hypothetical protein
MRRYIEIVEQASASDKVDHALRCAADYISGNLAPTDWHALAETLREIGYHEPIAQTNFFRALSHDPSDLDRGKHITIGDFYAELEQEVRFDMNRVQGFTTSFDNAIEFIHGQNHIRWNRHEWPTQTPDKPLSDHGNHSVVVVYEVEADPSRIVWSDRGLQGLLRRLPRTGPGWDKLNEALNDMWSGYGNDDEVVIDAEQGVRITGMTLYDSEEHLIG